MEEVKMFPCFEGDCKNSRSHSFFTHHHLSSKLEKVHFLFLLHSHLNVSCVPEQGERLWS